MTSTAAAPQTSLHRWLTACLLALLTFGACWAGAIVYWRARDGDPSTAELMLFLFVLPGTLLAGALLSRKQLADDHAAPAPSANPASASIALPDTAPRPLAIVAGAVRSPYGGSLAEVADALAGNRARPALDALLVDQDGLPVRTARCVDADDQPLRAEIAAWLAAHASAPDLGDEDLRDEDWRALVLGTEVARELAGQALAALPDNDQRQPMLQLVPVLPAGWTGAAHDAAIGWLAHTITQAGWPADRLDIAPPAIDAPGAVPVASLNALAMRAADGAPWCMLVACASCVGQDTVDAWAAAGTLQTAHQQRGDIPGEGAIGLLLAAAAPMAGGAVLAPLQRNLASAAGDPAALAMIVADTSPRRGRMLDLMGFADAAAQLDAEQDVIAFGFASGSCGAVGALTALGLAGHHAQDRGAPVLWVSHDDPRQQCAALLRPA